MFLRAAPLPVQQARDIAPRILAHLGDAVFHLFERENEVLHVVTVKEMRQMGDRYAAHAYPLSPKESKGELLRHCSDFMRYYTKAAEEAEALAKLHREQEPAIP